MPTYFDRYGSFRINGEIKPIPGITIPSDSGDKQANFKQGQSRLDKMSNLYYNNPYCGWLILLANPQFGGLEFNIPDMTSLVIPFPYDSAISRYITEVKNHKLLYGE